jgi:hypothetical protein
MLCNICSRINLDELVSEQGTKYHKNFVDLYNAAKTTCPLCEAVFEDHYANYENSQEDYKANYQSQHKRKLQAFGFRWEDIEYDLKEMSAESHPHYLEALKAEREEILALMPKAAGPQPSRVRAQKPKRVPESQSGLVEPVARPPAVPNNANAAKSNPTLIRICCLHFKHNGEPPPKKAAHL